MSSTQQSSYWYRMGLEAAVGTKSAAVPWKPLWSLIGRAAKNKVVQNIGGRALQGAAGWLTSPYAQRAAAGGSKNLPKDQEEHVSRALSLLTGLLTPPSWAAKHPLRTASMLEIPPVTSGLFYRAMGPGRTSAAVQAAKRMARIAGRAGNDPEFFREAGKELMAGARPEATSIFKPVLKDIGYGLGAGTLGAVGGYGLSKWLAAMRGEKPVFNLQHANSAEAAELYYRKRLDEESRQKALDAILMFLGGVGGSAAYMNRDAIGKAVKRFSTSFGKKGK